LATHDLGVAGSYWAFLVAVAFYFILPEKLALVANVIFAATVIPVAWNVLEHPDAIRFSSVLLGISFFAFLSIHEITRQHFLLKEKATIDPLTGLYNRSLLQYALEHTIRQSHRTSTAISLIMLDIDNFKSINDEYGHNVGDSVLESLGKLIRSYFRGSDIVFRIGGEEFLVLVHNTNEIGTLEIAEKLRLKIEEFPLIPGRTITASIGVAGIQPGMGWEEWMKLCDERMYRAKSNGKNQVVA
jgi:diguanylate cyclase (GGDEF)-like protein